MTSAENVKVFYGPQDPNTETNDYRLIPSPFININYTPIYTNDNVIGMSNKISLNGFVSTYIREVELNQLNLEQFGIQSFGSGLQTISTESGMPVSTENDSILVTSFGSDPNKSGPILITISSPSAFVSNNHELEAGDTIIFDSSGSLPSGIIAGNIYYVLSSGLTQNEFLVSSTPDGFPIAINSGEQNAVSVYANPDVANTQILNGSLSLNNHGLQVGDTIIFSPSDNILPSGLSYNTIYYVLSEGLTQNTFNISITSGGSAIPISSGLNNNLDIITNPSEKAIGIIPSNPTLFTKSDHGLQPGEMIILNTDGKLPDGLEENTIYYISEEDWTEDSFIVRNTPDGPPNITFGTQTGTHYVSVENDPGNVWTVTNIQNQRITNLRKTIENLKKTQDYLMSNGSVLTVYDKNNVKILEAVGGILKSLSFDQSSNSWAQNIPFSAEIEFSYINFFGENLSCNDYFSASSFVDSDKYRLQSFNDNWNINIGNESFSFISGSDIGNGLNISNNIIELSYNISAVGYDYYQADTDPPEFKPAWEIAKHFVQERLYDQVTGLFGNILKMSGIICQEADTDQATVGGFLSYLDAYSIFNETINCSFSELDGNFSASYNSIVKLNNTSSYDNGKVKHTLTKNISHNHVNNTAKVRNNISINGTIEGLIEGGLIRANKETFSLPKTGSFLIAGTGIRNKFNNAKNVWDLIKGDDDLSDDFKRDIGINNTYLTSITGTCITGIPIIPQSFSLTENKIDGIIEYQIEYGHNDCIFANSNRTDVVKNIAVDFKDTSPIFAEFNLPDIGTILQDIKTETAKEISFNITGRDQNTYKINSPYTILPVSHILTVANDVVDIPSILTEAGFYNYESGNWVVKNKSEDINIIDGSYTIQLTYMCSTACSGNQL